MLPSLPFKERFTSGRQLLPGHRMNSLCDMLTSASQVVALAGGNLPGAPVLNAAFVDLVTVATAADSAALPPAQIGMSITVTNSGVASATIWASGTDTISGAASQTHAPGVTVDYVCVKPGIWKRYTAA